MTDLGELLERLPDGFTPGPDDWGVKIEVAADRRRKAIEAERAGTPAQGELAK